MKDAMEKTRETHPFQMKCMCLLPEHLHCIMELPGEDKNYSLRLSLIKRYFTRAYIAQGGSETRTTESMRTHRNRGIWQKRFWEHVIRDEEDYANHVNYIHYNPLKHQLVQDVTDWPWSTYHQYKKHGWKEDELMIDLYDENGFAD